MSSICIKRFCHHASGIKHVSIFGSGLMGSGIAQVAAQSGFKVTLIDQNAQILDNAHKRILKSVEKVAKKQEKIDPKEFVENTISRISTKEVDASTATSVEVESSTDLIIEAIVENMQAKHNLFRLLDASAPAKTIFATNTSSLPVDEIFKHVKRSELIGGLHYFNPVPMMKLLEVVKGSTTSDDTFHKLCSFGSEMNKVVVKCKDTPGFIVNRLLVPYLAEAVLMLERGDAEMKDIDTAMKLGAGYPMGPFELIDYVGLDTTEAILNGWCERYPDMFTVPETVKKLVAEGKLGRKSGEGFYKY